MRYRIKIITYKTGEQKFIPQKKKFIGWVGVDYNGQTEYFNNKCSSRNIALMHIDNNYNGKRKKVKIEFEYINK